MADKNRNSPGQQADRSSIGNKQRTIQTGGANQGGQSPDNNRGEGSRERHHARGKKGRA